MHNPFTRIFHKRHTLMTWVNTHRAWSVGVLVVLAVFVGYNVFSKHADTGEPSLDQSQKPVTLLSLGDIQSKQVVATASGAVESLDEVTLSSEVFGTVSRVYAHIGDTVRAGQVLVQFTAADRAAQRTQAGADYDSAVAAKASLLAQIDAAKATHEKLLVSTQNSIAAADAAVKTAYNALQQIETTGSNAVVDNAYDDMVGVLDAIENTLVVELTLADGFLGIDNTFANDTYEAILSVKNLSALNNAKQAYEVARIKKQTLEYAMTQVGVASSHDTIDQAVDHAADALDQFHALFGYLTDMLMATAPIGNLTQTGLDGLMSSVDGGRATLTAQHTALTNAVQAIATAKNSFSAQAIAYDKAVRDLSDKQAQAVADIAASEAGLKQLEATLAGQDAHIKRASGVIAGINAELAKTRVQSPIAGVVAELPVTEGELVTSGALVARVINTDGLQITAYIPSSALSRLAVGSVAELDGQRIGQVIRIAPSINQTTKKVEVVVSIDEDVRSQFVVGQFVDIDLLASAEADIAQEILVPFQAVRISAEGPAVFVVEDGHAVLVPVETGLLIGDKIQILSDLSSYTEIVSSVRGLSDGDTVSVQ